MADIVTLSHPNCANTASGQWFVSFVLVATTRLDAVFDSSIDDGSESELCD
jgi:hypothetical protein